MIKLYKYPVRKISKCKMEHHNASLVNKLLGVSCMHNFSLSNNPKHFVNKQHVTTFILNHFHIAVSELRYHANPHQENPPSKVKQQMKSIFFKAITSDSVHRLPNLSLVSGLLYPLSSQVALLPSPARLKTISDKTRKHYLMLNQFGNNI